LMWQLIVIGAPISFSFLLEYGLFGAAGLLMGLISTTALAAHQIALQVAAILTLAVMVSRFGIAEVFLGESTDATAELSATLLLVGSTFFIADAIQTVAAGSLRGMNDTRVPLLFAILSYWLIGFALACWLGFRTS